MTALLERPESQGLDRLADAGPEDALLTLRGIVKRFQTRRHDTVAIDHVSLHVATGEFICLVGPSGCGKSTLLNIAAGLDRPDEGAALFDGEPIRKPGPERSVVFQDAALFPWLDVRANVEFGLKVRGVPRGERRERGEAALTLVGLAPFARAYVHELSGGMRQRAQLARALAVEPRMLLMDEPFAALDAQTRDVLQVELQSLRERTSGTVLFVTHNIREAVILADRIIVMSAGPGRVVREIAVDLPRPRHPDSPAIATLAAEVRAALGAPEATP